MSILSGESRSRWNAFVVRRAGEDTLEKRRQIFPGADSPISRRIGVPDVTMEDEEGSAIRRCATDPPPRHLDSIRQLTSVELAG